MGLYMFAGTGVGTETWVDGVEYVGFGDIYALDDSVNACVVGGAGGE